MEDTTTKNQISIYDYLNKFILNPMFFVIIILIIVAYLVFPSSSDLGSNKEFSIANSNNSSSFNILGIIIFIILMILILMFVFQYFLNIDIISYIKGLFTITPEKNNNIVVEHNNNVVEHNNEKKEDLFSKIKFKKQVFNIPGNNYNYEDAKAICKAYDSDLATYEQLENAYNNGAEWCNYGWSANQMAFYPTQKQTYNTLQTIKGHENDCGRPGINGGYIENPNVKFGVNCYGFKPRINAREEELMQKHTPYPETKQEKEFQKKVDFWKDKTDEILISPFNYNIWG